MLLFLTFNLFSQFNLGKHFTKRERTYVDSIYTKDCSTIVQTKFRSKIIINFFNSDDVCDCVVIYFSDEDYRDYYKQLLTSSCTKMLSSNEWILNKDVSVKLEDDIFYFTSKKEFKLTKEQE